MKGIHPELNKHCVQFYLSAEQFELLAVVLAQFGAVHEHRHIHGKEKALMAALSTLAEHGANGTQQPLS